jgi:hypothetical protein
MWPCVGEKRNAYGILLGNLKDRILLEELGTNGRTILRWTIKKWDEMALTEFYQVMIGKSSRLI